MRILKLKSLAPLLLLLAGTTTGRSFSLSGPIIPEWQTGRIGYGGALGPMSIQEEYRWNVPVIYYSITPDFLNYFGNRGAQEIEKAVKLINELPTVDGIDINNYPLTSQRVNFRAQALFLNDVRSYALSTLMTAMGLFDPAIYVYTLRNRYPIPNTQFFTLIVIKRNFDPDTWQHSSFINGQLWTYSTILDPDTPPSITVPEPVDPLALGGLRNAPVAAFSLLSVGGFWSSLTRDDVAGLHFLYHTGNVNVETAPTNTFASQFGPVNVGSGGSPWTPVTGGSLGTGGGAVAGATTNFINTALRPGLGKIILERVHYDSILGVFPTNLVSWTDRFLTNSQIVEQTLIRPQVDADIIFDAGDMSGPEDPPTDPPGDFAGFVNDYQNNDALNGNALIVDGVPINNGPGQISPVDAVGGVWRIVYSTVGPRFLNSEPATLSEALAGRFALWASFDGSTNSPFVYPHRSTLEEVERMVLAGESSDGVVGVGGVQPWSPIEPPIVVVDTGGGGGAGDGGTAGFQP